MSYLPALHITMELLGEFYEKTSYYHVTWIIITAYSRAFNKLLFYNKIYSYYTTKTYSEVRQSIFLKKLIFDQIIWSWCFSLGRKTVLQTKNRACEPELDLDALGAETDSWAELSFKSYLWSLGAWFEKMSALWAIPWT